MILVMDDEKVRLEPWLDALKEKFPDMELLVETDHLVTRLEDRARPPPELIIMDIMMPTPTRGLTEKETEYGSRTGVAFYRRIRKHWPATRVVFLTNVYDDGLRAHLRLRPSDRFFQKAETGPTQLVEEVGRLLGVSRGG